MGLFRLLPLLLLRACAGCARIADSEQVRLCRLVLPVLHAEGTEIREIRVAQAPHRNMRVPCT